MDEDKFICGCCGKVYRAFPDSVDDEHDYGYGQCDSCREWVRSRWSTPGGWGDINGLPRGTNQVTIELFRKLACPDNPAGGLFD